MLAVSMPTSAQTKIKEGRLVYGVSYEDLPDEMKAFAGMMPSEMVMKFKKDWTRIEMGIGVGTSVTITNSKTKETMVLLDIMGQKKAGVMSDEEIKKAKEESANVEQMDVEYTGETKEVAGYMCKEVVIELDEDGNTMALWITEDLDLSGGGPQLPAEIKESIKGFPLEYAINQGQFTMVMSAKEILKEKVSDDEFEVPAGYEKVSMEELQNSVGGMGGF